MACEAWSGAFWTKRSRRLESEVVPLLLFIIYTCAAWSYEHAWWHIYLLTYELLLSRWSTPNRHHVSVFCQIKSVFDVTFHTSEHWPHNLLLGLSFSLSPVIKEWCVQEDFRLWVLKKQKGKLPWRAIFQIGCGTKPFWFVMHSLKC